MANNERKDHFSIRKFSVGAASVLVGASVFGLATQTVHAAEEDRPIMGEEVLGNETNVKEMLKFFDNPTPAINQVNEQIAEIKSEKEVVRNPNDYSQDSFQKYTETVKVAEASIPAAEQAVQKAEEIQGKAEGLRKEMAEILPPEVRKDINYNVVTQEQKRAMNNRFKEMYTEVNYRTTYISATTALSESHKSLKAAVKGLVTSTAKDLVDDGTFDDKVPEASKIKVKSFASLTSEDQTKISALIEDHFNIAPLSPSISYDQTNAIITYDDKSITRLPLTEVAIAESNDTPAPTPKPEVKKALLEAAITKALEALKPADTSNKTEDSVAAYQKALTALTTETAKAEAVKVDTSVDQPKVDQAVTDLTAAIKTVEAAKTALVDKPAPTPSVDKAKLEEALTKAVEALKPADTTNKTEDSVSAYQKALANLTSEKAKAETVKNDAKADQPKVNQAEKDLTAAITVVEAAKSALVEKQAEKPKPKVVEKDETKVEVLAYKTIRRDNADLEKGTENVVQKGKDGSITTVEHVVIVDGVEKERKVVSTNKVDAVDEIIEVGTKVPAAPVEPSKPEPKVVEKEETKVEVVPYKTVRRDNADLEKGTEKVVQEGKAGSITTVVKIVIVDGVEKERKVVSTDKVDAVDKIIEVGTKEPAAPVEPSKPTPKVVEKEETKVEVVPYKTVRRDNADLEKGKEKVVQEGKAGSITTVVKIVIVDGVEKERKVVSTDKVDAVDKIIEVGTKEPAAPVEPSKPTPKVVEKEETKVEVVPYKTVRRDNADLEKGKEKVVQEGKAGSITTVVKIVIVDGVEKERKVVSTDKVDAVDKIIEVGTKEPAAPVEPSKPEPKVVEKDETKVEILPFKTIRRDNANLAKGTEKVVQEGKEGIITTIEHVVLVDGVEKERKVVVSNKVDAVDKIIEVGTKESSKPSDTPVEPSKPETKIVEKNETKVEIVSYKTIRRDNANLEKGTEKVVQEGKDGIVTTVERVVIVDGKEVERKVVSTNKVDAVDKIIEVGTKESSKPGDTPVEPAKPEVKIVEKDETKVEVLSYKTIRQDNANLAKGVEKVIQEGKDGSITTVEHVVLADGKEVERKLVSMTKVDAIDKIIEVGTKVTSTPGDTPVEPAKPEAKIVEKEETKVEVLSYKTIRRDNANLAKGTEKVVQEGKDGSITTVERIVLVDGKEVERKVVSTNKVDAVDKIIEVGTKVTSTPGDTPVVPAKPEAKVIEKYETKKDTVAFKTIRRDNANLAKGTEKVAQEGKDGSVTTVERVVYVDGKETERKVVSTTKVDAVDKIIEVGTKEVAKPADPTKPVVPSKPVDPTKPVDPAKPVNPTKPVVPAKPVNPAKPVEPTKPTDSAKPAVKPEQPVNTPVKPNQSTAKPSAVAEKPAEPAKKPVATKDSSGKEQLPNTGTEASGLSALGISLMAAASALFVGKRKKNDKE